MLPISSLGGVGGGGGGYSASSSATSGNTSGDVSNKGESGAGNRGNQINIAFPGSNFRASADINPPAFNPMASLGPYATWAAVGLLGFVLVRNLKR